MEYDLLKSKRDKYEIHEARITDSNQVFRVDMKLKHLETHVVTEGTLIISTDHRPGRFRDEASEIRKKEDASARIRDHFEETAYDMDEGVFLFKPTKDAIYLNKLIENVSTNIMIDKSKHRLVQKRDKFIENTVNTFFPQVSAITIDKEVNSVDIYTLVVATSRLKDLVDLIQREFKLNEPTVTYHLVEE